MTLNKENLENIKSELLAKRQFLAKGIVEATANLIDDEPMFADSIDQASADTEKSLSVQIKNRERDILWEIDEALRRIESGTFGECIKCGESIMEARMKANPSTTLCIDCKSEVESEQGHFPRRA